MRKSAFLLLTTVLSLAFAPAPLPRPDTGKDDLKKMQGTWEVTAFRVAGAIGAVAVELSLGLLQNLRARFARAFAMSVDVLAFRELDVDGLRVLAADGFGALVIVAPLVADHDDGIPEGHL